MQDKKSTIPPQAQIPVAIGLAVLFAVILAWRFFPWDKEGEEAVPATLQTGSALQFSLEDLTETLEALQSQHVTGLPRPSELPPLARNPFLTGEVGLDLAAVEPPSSADDEGAGVSVARQLALAARDKLLAGLALSATCVAGESSGALINGSHLRIGDEIAGLTVQQIGERQVVLADDLGAHIIEIQEPPWLLHDETGQTDLPPAHKETNS